MDDELHEIYVAASLEQAHLLKNVLEQEGITAYIRNEALAPVLGKVPIWPASARVVVHEQDAAEARRIALELQAPVAQGVAVGEEDHAAPQKQAELDPAWPRCPSCAAPRLTSCPICGTAGTQFARGFLPGGESSDRAEGDEAPSAEHSAPGLVLCPICDEAFEPEFQALCEWCGHRFADGREPAPLPAVALPELNVRVLVVLGGVVLVVAATIAFFASLVK